MILLLIFQLSGPALPPVHAQAELTPVSMETVLFWQPSPTPGCSNRIYAWNSLTTTNLDLGTNTVLRVTQPVVPRTYYKAVAVLGGIEATNWNVIGVPAKHVDIVYAQRDGKDIGLVDSWTNQPAAPLATYRLRVERTEDYRP